MHDRLEAESVARAHVSGHLAPQVTMIDQTDSLDERALDAIADHPRTGAAAKDRFPIDVEAGKRPPGLFALRPARLWHSGTSRRRAIVELVGAVAYVGDSESRAAN